MSARGVLGGFVIVVILGTGAAGCRPGQIAVEYAAPTTAVALPNPVDTPVLPSTSQVVTTESSNSAVSVPSVGIPVCGSEFAPFTGRPGVSTPAPDTCSFPEGGSASPGCPDQPTQVVAGTETRQPGAADRVTGTAVAGFGRFGGRGGGPMCFAEYPGGALLVTNAYQAVLLPASAEPMRVAGRTQLARSDAIWGAVDATIDHVELRDASRPNGFAATLTSVDSRVRVFVAPVSAGPVTITAFSPAGTAVQAVHQG